MKARLEAYAHWRKAEALNAMPPLARALRSLMVESPDPELVAMREAFRSQR